MHVIYVIKMSIAVPMDPPKNLQVSVINATSVHLAWSPPLYPYGYIESYTILVKDGMIRENATIIHVNSTLGTSNIVAGLFPFTHYNFSIAASTRIGTGPYDTISIITPQASKCSVHAAILQHSYLTPYS